MDKINSTLRDNILLLQHHWKKGPASRVEEHSLRKNFRREDRGSILAEDTSFQTRSFQISHKCLTERPTIEQATISQPRSERAVAIHSTV